MCNCWSTHHISKLWKWLCALDIVRAFAQEQSTDSIRHPGKKAKVGNTMWYHVVTQGYCVDKGEVGKGSDPRSMWDYLHVMLRQYSILRPIKLSVLEKSAAMQPLPTRYTFHLEYQCQPFQWLLGLQNSPSNHPMKHHSKSPSIKTESVRIP